MEPMKLMRVVYLSALTVYFFVVCIPEIIRFMFRVKLDAREYRAERTKEDTASEPRPTDRIPCLPELPCSPIKHERRAGPQGKG